ncbi:MAG: hypothetical protein NC824_04290 [Candidatus Omnitrophica bacterium]|nr:hypothetical protein [Candidatus Omnitrophota bacterium]
MTGENIIMDGGLSAK